MWSLPWDGVTLDTGGAKLDEAIEQAFKTVAEAFKTVAESHSGLRVEVGQVRHDISGLRDDFKAHTVEDHKDIGELQKKVADWTGQAKIIGVIAAAILTALIVQIVNQWKR